MKYSIFNNIWLKLVSLVLAVITWNYVNRELEKEHEIQKQLYKTSLIGSHQKKSEPKVEKGNKGYIMEKKIDAEPRS